MQNQRKKRNNLGYLSDYNKMKAKTGKIIITLLIIVGVGALINKFPDEMILILGIGLIIIIGNWLLDANKAEYT